MSGSPASTTCPAPAALPEALCARLYLQAGAERFGLAQQDFAGILQEVAAQYLPGGARILRGFRTRIELASRGAGAGARLRPGQRSGLGGFPARYREKLYQAAHTIAREDSAARDLADSLYADLYGTRTADGRRVSKLDSFTGRGSLEGWLRAVLAQEYVNRFRRQQRLVSLEEQTEAGVQFQAAESMALRRPIRAWKKPRTKPSPRSPRKTNSFWPAIISMDAPWLDSRACWACTNPRSAAGWRKSPPRFAKPF